MKLDGIESNHADLYALLNVSQSATVADIQRSYKTLSRVFHPDKAGRRKEDAEKTFVAIKQAHDVLSDNVYRQAYDFGGLLLVALIKRSQAAARSARATQEDRANDDGDDQSSHDGHETNEGDLYEEINQAHSTEAANKILREMMNEYRWHQDEARSSQLHLSTTATFPHNYGRHFIEPESGSVQFQARRQLGHDVSVTLSSNSRMQTSALTDVQGSVGMEYRVNRGTTVTVDTAMNHNNGGSQMSLRTSRQMGNGTFFLAALNGNPQSMQTWTYSLVSYRNLLWETSPSWSDSKEDTNKKEPTKMQASWRVGFKPSTFELQHAMASLKTRHFPQWGCRLSFGGAFPLKVHYQTAPSDSLYAAYSWNFMFSRIKLAWMQQLDDDWTLKYGLKFDGRAAFTGSLSTWSIIFQLISDEWTLRLPISLFQDATFPVASFITVLLSQLFDKHLSEWLSTAFTPDTQQVKSKSLSPPTSHQRRIQVSPSFTAIIAEIAGKKRRLEAESATGLVILDAKWESTGSPRRIDVIDVTDLLQYWVVNGSLSLPIEEAKRWLDPVSDSEEKGNEKSWWSLAKIRLDFLSPNISTATAVDVTRTLHIRYRFGNSVYEIVFDDDHNGVLNLPDRERATLVGDARMVK